MRFALDTKSPTPCSNYSDTSRGSLSTFRFSLASIGLVLSLSGCSFYAGGSAKTGGSSGGSASGSAQPKADAASKANAKGADDAKASGKSKVDVNVHAGGQGSGSTKAASNADASGDGTGKSSLKIGANGKLDESANTHSKVVFKTKVRAKGVAKSKKKDSFKASSLIKGGIGGSVSAHGHAHMDAEAQAKAEEKAKLEAKHKAAHNDDKKTVAVEPKKDVKKDPPKKVEPTKVAKNDPPKKADPPKKVEPTKVAKNDPPKKADPTPPAKETPVAVVPPTTTAPPAPIDPPDEAPDNVFGYEAPVRGCFEGIVYPLRARTQHLPTAWTSLEALSAVYACEWDIPSRAWSTGFPGVSDLFEWFAIRYSGSFLVQTAGTWNFRISSDDGAKLFIDGKEIINNDGVHSPEVKEGTARLVPGEHEMVLEYFQGPRYLINLQLYATPPGGVEGIFSVR